MNGLDGCDNQLVVKVIYEAPTMKKKPKHFIAPASKMPACAALFSCITVN